ncbi:hypothetical protein [Hyalangium sp.]|uniref:hypothetical protein n=1 Tax=Hyalangium sp. TaxID=2028555 RepID=UPI002D5AFAA1|nr:hypothetical protein [Hyalangium sp.]HYI02897.1 hypothetical protein [Hyalangium sp.]
MFLLVAGLIGKADGLLTRMLASARNLLVSAPRTFQLLRWVHQSVHSVRDVRLNTARLAFSLSVPLAFDHIIERAYKIASTRDMKVDSNYEVTHPDRAVTTALELTLELDRDFNPSLLHSVQDVCSLANDPTFAATLTSVPRKPQEIFEIFLENTMMPLCEKLTASRYFSVDFFQTALRFYHLRPTLNAARGLQDQSYNLLTTILRLPQELCPMRLRELAPLQAYLNACQLILSSRKAATSVSRATWDDLCAKLFTAPDEPFTAFSINED